jgi:hypothetical protein
MDGITHSHPRRPAMSPVLLLTAITALHSPEPSGELPAPPTITVVSPADGATMSAPSKATGPKVLKVTARVEAKPGQWKPDSLIFKVTDPKEPQVEYGSFGVVLDPRQADGRHDIQGELKFRYLPSGRYLVKVRALKGTAFRLDSEGRFLEVTR